MKSDKTQAVEAYLSKLEIHQQWEGDFRTPENESFYEEAFDELVRRVGATEGAVWLDAGCGVCFHSARLARRTFRVEAFDFSDGILHEARQNLRRWGLDDRIGVRQADLLTLPFADGEFSYVLCWGVLMHVPEVERAVAELVRVTAAGGWIVISEGNMCSLQAVALRNLKRLLRGRSGQKRTPAGMEEWTDTDEIHLLTRQADVSWLIERFREQGCTLERRAAGQFTEIYTIAPRALHSTIHAVNRFWFRHVRRGGPAFGNLLFLRRRG